MRPVERRFRPDERRALLASMVGGSIVPLNSTMIAVALPAIADDLDVEPGRAAILVTAYLVAMLVCQPVGGRLGDRHGHRAVATLAMGGFAAASVLATFAPTFAFLLVARCLQAAAGSAFAPNLQAILRSAVDDERRGRAFGLMGSGIGVGAAIGPVVGGLLVASGTWRTVFIVNAPVVIPAIVLLARLSSGGVVGAPSHRGDSTRLRAALLQPSFVAACVTQASSNFAMYGLLLLLPLVLAAAEWSTLTIGLSVSVLTLGMLFLAPVGGSAGDRHGRTTMIRVGTAAATAGCAIVAIGLPSPVALILGALVVGCGLGLSGASLQTIALESVPVDATASAAGFFSTSRYVGSIGSSAVIAGVAVDARSSARSAAVAIVVAAFVATTDKKRAKSPGLRPVEATASPSG